MEKFKDKKTGAIYTINDSSVLNYFTNNSNYEKLGEKNSKKKTTTKEEKITEEVEQPENTEEVEQPENTEEVEQTTPEAE